MAANLAACAQFGITEPVASELSAREWVSPEYIAAHMQGLDDWDTLRLAVVRMRADEPSGVEALPRQIRPPAARQAPEHLPVLELLCYLRVVVPPPPARYWTL